MKVKNTYAKLYSKIKNLENKSKNLIQKIKFNLEPVCRRIVYKSHRLLRCKPSTTINVKLNKLSKKTITFIICLNINFKVILVIVTQKLHF